jgi:hypothetical protein
MQVQRRQRARRERSSEGRHYPLQCFANVWPDSFFTRHDLSKQDEIPAVEMKEGMGGVADKLRIFLGLEEGLHGPCEADAVQRFCKDASLKDIDVGIGESGRRKASWIDDRNSKDLTGSGSARLCESMLTATGLLRYLKQSVCPRLHPIGQFL